jgi:hypothetical protein
MVDYEKLKPGDKVRLVSQRPLHWNKAGDMDEYLDSTQVIQTVWTTTVHFKNHPPKWSFKLEDIAEVLTPNTINNSYTLY